MVVGVWTGVTGEQIRLGSFRWVWCPRYFSSIHFEPRARKCRSNLALLQAFSAVTLSLVATIEVTAKKSFLLPKIHLPVYFLLGGRLPPNPCWAVTVRSITSFSAGIATPVTITGSPPRMEVLAVGKTNGRWLVRSGGVG